LAIGDDPVLNCGVGNVVAVKVGSKIFNLMVNPVDDAYTLLKQLGVSATLGYASATTRDQDGLVATPQATRFVLRSLIGKFAEPIPAEFLNDPLKKIPQFEIVDLNNPNFELPSGGLAPNGGM